MFKAIRLVVNGTSNSTVLSPGANNSPVLMNVPVVNSTNYNESPSRSSNPNNSIISVESPIVNGSVKSFSDLSLPAKKVPYFSAQNRSKSNTSLNNMIGTYETQMFSCTIGSATKKTQANWHVPRVEDIIQLLTGFAEVLRNE